MQYISKVNILSHAGTDMEPRDFKSPKYPDDQMSFVDFRIDGSRGSTRCRIGCLSSAVAIYGKAGDVRRVEGVIREIFDIRQDEIYTCPEDGKKLARSESSLMNGAVRYECSACGGSFGAEDLGKPKIKEAVKRKQLESTRKVDGVNRTTRRQKLIMFTKETPIHQDVSDMMTVLQNYKYHIRECHTEYLGQIETS